MLRWLVAFAVTQAIEGPLYVVGQAVDGPPRPLGRRVLWGLAPSALTHPVVWWLVPLAGRSVGASYLATVLAAELFAVAVEAALLHRLGVARALRWSLLANATSAGLGLLSRSLTGWP